MTSGSRTVWLDDTRVALAPSALIGQGGEAEVYALGDGRVVKWWKPADHPDFAGLPELQAAARQRRAALAARSPRRRQRRDRRAARAARRDRSPAPARHRDRRLQ